MGYDRHTDQNIPNTTKNAVFSVVWGLKKEGYSDHTIKFVRKALLVIEKGCGLEDPDGVTGWIARLDVADSYKRNLCYAYQHYLRDHELEWDRPRYYSREKLPKIPSEKTISMIISASRPTLALQLSMSMKTGLRPVELLSLKVKEADMEKGIIYPSSAKHGSAKALQIKSKTLSMLKVYVNEANLGLNDKLFSQTFEEYAKSFARAARLSDLDLNKCVSYSLLKASTGFSLAARQAG